MIALLIVAGVLILALGGIIGLLLRQISGVEAALSRCEEDYHFLAAASRDQETSLRKSLTYANKLIVQKDAALVRITMMRTKGMAHVGQRMCAVARDGLKATVDAV